MWRWGLVSAHLVDDNLTATMHAKENSYHVEVSRII